MALVLTLEHLNSCKNLAMSDDHVNEPVSNQIKVFTMQQALIGVIGGSGLYHMEALQNATEHSLDTPYGKPSDVIVTGLVQDVPVAFLARHGRDID